LGRGGEWAAAISKLVEMVAAVTGAMAEPFSISHRLIGNGYRSKKTSQTGEPKLNCGVYAAFELGCGETIWALPRGLLPICRICGASHEC